jgi:uridine phosphorylase
LTSDAYYGDLDNLRRWSRYNVLSVEMECSAIFALAKLRKLQAGAILAVDSKPLLGLEKGEFEPYQKTGELDDSVQGAIEEEIHLAIETIKALDKQIGKGKSKEASAKPGR